MLQAWSAPPRPHCPHEGPHLLDQLAALARNGGHVPKMIAPQHHAATLVVLRTIWACSFRHPHQNDPTNAKNLSV